MAKTRPLKDTDDGGPIGGLRLANNIRRAEEQRDKKAGRYARNRANLLGDPPPRPNPPEEGAADCHYPIVQPVGDALSAWIVGTVTSIEPWCVPSVDGDVKEGEDDPATVVQKAVWDELKKANPREAVKKASQPACYANAGILWMSWSEGKIRLDIVTPKRFVVYPSCRGISDCLLYGRSFDRTRGEIRALAKEGYYFAEEAKDGVDALVDGLTPDSAGGPSAKDTADHPGMTEVTAHQSAVYSEDDLIELHECVVRNPEDGKSYVCTVHKDSGTLLKQAEYTWAHQCAFVFRFKTEATDEFWHEGSVAQDLQGIQRDVNEALNVFMDAVGMSSYGAAFTTAANMGQSKAVRYGRGTMTPVLDPTRMAFFSPSVQAAGCIEIVQFLESKSQAVARLSSMAQGGSLKNTGGDTTKFEAEQAVAGQNTGIEDYVENFVSDLPCLFAHAQELVDAFAELAPDVKTAVHKKCTWAPQVTSPSGTPSMQARALFGLFELAQSPETGIDVHETASRYLEFLERQGVTDATGLQLPADPVMAVAKLTGLHPLVVKAALTDAAEAQQALEAQAGAAEPSASGGMAGAPGGGPLSLMGGGPPPETVGVA